MPTIAVNINLTTIGTGAGPFTISDNVLGVLATNVPRTSLLGNYVVNADTTATQITVTSTGECTNAITIPIDFHPCGTGPAPTTYYYFTMTGCCGEESIIGRTTNPSIPVNTYLYNSICYTIGASTLNSSYQLNLDTGTIVSGCGDVSCPSCPPPPTPGDCKQNTTINVTDYGWIKYYNCTTATTEYQFMSGLGNVVLTNCLDYTTLLPGFPLADVAAFTLVSPGIPCSTPPPPTPNTSTWIIRNADCGFGVIYDVGINGSFMGSLEGPSSFPLSSTLYGVKTNPNGINYNTANNTVQVNVTTNLPGSGNCGFLRIYLNGQSIPTYEVQFTSQPYVNISGLYFASGDQVELVVNCYPNCEQI